MLPTSCDSQSLNHIHKHWAEYAACAAADEPPKATRALYQSLRSVCWAPTVTNVLLATTMLPLCVLLLMVLAHAGKPAARVAVKAPVQDSFEDIWQHYGTYSTFSRQLVPSKVASLNRQQCLREHGGKLPKVLLLSVFKDGVSFGWTPNINGTGERRRNLGDHLALLSSLDYPPCLLSLALLVSDRGFFEAEATQLAPDFAAAKGFGRITIIFREADTGMAGTSDRHDDNKQFKRRSTLARVRNFAVNTALLDEQVVLWTDCDMVGVPSSMLKDMVAANKDIITPVCNEYEPGGTNNHFYDRNSWAGPRNKPTEEQWTMHKNGSQTFVPTHAEGNKYPSDMVNSTESFEQLDSVGATVLFVKADIHREGALFAVTPVIGAEWGHEGYDGLESEGLCFTAKALGYKCWAMTKVLVSHSRN